MASSRARCLTSSPCVAIRPTNCPAPAASDPKGAAALLRRYGTLEQALADGRLTEQAEALQALQEDRDDGRHGAASRRCLIRRRPGRERLRLRATGISSVSLAGWRNFDRCNRPACCAPPLPERPRAAGPGTGAEDRDVQHQQRQPPAAEPPCLARRVEARRGLSAGAQVHRRCVSRGRDARRRVSRDLARAAHLQRRGNPCQCRGAPTDPRPAPRRSDG